MNTVRICVPVCVGDARALSREVERAAQLGDFVELRFDCLEAAQVEAALSSLDALLDSTQRPLILTFRSARQGGRRSSGDAEREMFRRAVVTLLDGRRRQVNRPASHFIDLEFGDGLNPDKIEELRGLCSVICSHHDFDGRPTNLEQLYERMAASKASFIKIAVMAQDATDCLAVFRLLERARAEGRKLIAHAMGEAGVVTRILGPSRGSFLTYGALDNAQRTATGQTTADELRKLYRVESIDEETLINGLIGSPVAHSLSPHMHNAALAARSLNGVYVPFEVRDLEAFMRRMADPRTREIEWNLRGLSVTAPHKQAVIKHLSWVEPKALEIGAVNTIIIEGDELRGYNTDADAALTPLEGLIELRGARAAVLGAGGAAHAVLWGLKAPGARATVFARNPERARATARQFDADTSTLERARLGDFDIVINTTPLGTHGPREDETPATAAQLRGARAAYDLVYNPSVTRFMREAQEAGCETVGGLPMLVAQAATQFKLWTGQEAPADVVLRAAGQQM